MKFISSTFFALLGGYMYVNVSEGFIIFIILFMLFSWKEEWNEEFPWQKRRDKRMKKQVGDK